MAQDERRGIKLIDDFPFMLRHSKHSEPFFQQPASLTQQFFGCRAFAAFTALESKYSYPTPMVNPTRRASTATVIETDAMTTPTMEAISN